MNLVLYYLAGLGLSISPCTLPLVPIALSMVVGENKKLSSLVWYCIGSVMSYVAIILIYHLFGQSLQILFNGIHTRICMAILLTIVALFLCIEKDISIPIPQWVYVIINKINQPYAVYKLAFGFLSTLIVSPCLTVPLAAILTSMGTTSTVIGSIASALMFGLGLNTPLLALGLSGYRIKVPIWMFNVVKYLISLSLFVTAYRLVF